jgi:hypothetical protein
MKCGILVTAYYLLRSHGAFRTTAGFVDGMPRGTLNGRAQDHPGIYCGRKVNRGLDTGIRNARLECIFHATSTAGLATACEGHGQPDQMFFPLGEVATFSRAFQCLLNREFRCVHDLFFLVGYDYTPREVWIIYLLRKVKNR